MTSAEFVLPDPPLGGPTVTVVRWLKRPGEPVAAGDPLLIVVNDRVEMALPSPIGGVLDAIAAGVGAQADAGSVVATIAPAAAPISASSGSKIDITEFPRSPRLVSPAARRAADVENIDIRDVSGSGPSGRVMKSDVLSVLAVQAQPERHSAPLADLVSRPRDEPFARFSSHGALPGHSTHVQLLEPQALTAVEVDLGRVGQARSRYQAARSRRSVELSELAFIAAAVTEALLRQPLLNSAWAEHQIILRRRIHLAVVDEAGRHALVRDAQDLNVLGIARALSDSGAGSKLWVDATFAIYMTSDQGWFATPALVPGRSAALGVGALGRRPVVVAEAGVDRLVVRPTTLLTLAYDARALDQCSADRFLTDVKRSLERLS